MTGPLSVEVWCQQNKSQMRFKLGAIPCSPDFVPDTTWRTLREPSPWLLNLASLPIGIVTAAVVTGLWYLLTPLRDVTPAISLPNFLVSFMGIVFIHELIHALFHPMAGRSAHSILGFWPSGGMFYAHYDGELKRNRFVAILLMPLIFISFVPLLSAAAAREPSGWVAFISAFNAFLACADILSAALVLFQIPSTAIIRQQSWRTYWREPDRLDA